jgi:hypothetical protein
MGYLDVRLHHGPTEQGKDIVMWQRSATSDRRNVAVVVKSGRISGRASGEGSAAEVATQIRQCFSSTFLDAGSPEERLVHECFVVCPHPMTPPALETLKNTLGEPLMRGVTYIDGPRLWELVRHHLGPRTVLAQLKELGSVLEGASPNYRLVARAKGAQIEVGVEEKHARALEEEPLRIHASFHFPDDQQGRAARQAFLKHVETGAAVSVRREHISAVRLPGLMREVFGEEVASIAISPRVNPEPVYMILRAENQVAEVASTPELAFRCTQVGTKEATFSATRDPFDVRLVFNREQRRFNLTYAMKLDGVNVAEALDAIRLQRLMAEGCTFRLLDCRTRLPIVEAPAQVGEIGAVERFTEELLSDLRTIQDATRTAIAFPEDDLTADVVRQIRGIAKGLRIGIVPVRISDASASMRRPAVEQIVNTLGDSLVFRIAMVSEESVTIGRTVVPVGAVARIIMNATLAHGEHARLLEALRDPQATDFDVKVDCSNAETKALYLRWLPPEELARYSEMFPILKEHATKP